MINFDSQLDITKNIKMIEILKSQILTGVADLNASFLEKDTTTSDQMEIFADLTILIYILAKRLGISPQALLLKINKKLKIGVIEDADIFSPDAKELLRYFNSL